jgi:hypothetical protein
MVFGLYERPTEQQKWTKIKNSIFYLLILLMTSEKYYMTMIFGLLIIQKCNEINPDKR